MKKLANSAVKSALVNGGRVAGGMAGNYIGMPVTGSKVGKKIGARISKMIGSGDYECSTDVVLNSLVKPGASQYASFSDSTSSVRLKHREYLQDAFNGPISNAFNNTVFEINPGLSSSFPFLAQIASNFEEYKMHGLVFEFISTTSPYNSTSAMGSVIMAMEYNAAAAPFTSKPQMENSDFAISARPDKSMLYGVECADNATNHLFIRTGTSDLPLTTTDIGLFNFATLSPLAAGTTLGEIWVTYDVELFRPKISPLRFGYFHASLKLPALLPAGTLVTGDYTIQRGSYSPVAPVANGTATDFQLSTDGVTTLVLTGADVGDVYMITVNYIGATAGQNVTGAFTNATQLLVYDNYTASGAGLGAAAGSTFDAIFKVNSNAAAPTITLTLSTVGGAAASNVDIFIVNIGNGFDATTL